MSRLILHSRFGTGRTLVFTGLFAYLFSIAPGLAQAPPTQAPPTQPRAATPDVGEGGSNTGKRPKPKSDQAGPAKPEEKGDPSTPAGRRAIARTKTPQTADEKVKQLADLYAQLQTAEDEESAKKVSGAIERLWAYSGSDTVNLLMQRSSKAITEKKKDLALRLLDRTVDLAPDYPEAFNQRAYYHFTENNYEAAVGDLRRVLALDPNHYKALEGLAQIWRDTGNKKGAYKVMQQLLEIHPYASGAKQIHDDLKKEVDGQGI